MKLYSWVDIFLNKIKELREDEIVVYKTKVILYTLIITSLYFFPNVLSTVVLTTYIGTGHYINLSNAFTVLVFFDLIRYPIRSLPMIYPAWLEMLVSLNRIQDFINSHEVSAECLIHNHKQGNQQCGHSNEVPIPKIKSDQYAIKIDHHSFTWGVK